MACGDAVRIRVLIGRAFGVLDNRPYVWTFLHTVGLALQKARLVSDHLDTVKRLVWLEPKWPTMFRAAKRRRGVILFAEEARCAPWGSLRSTWARRGQPPEVPTSGKRQGDNVLGAMAYCSGRRFSPGIEGRFHAESSQAF